MKKDNNQKNIENNEIDIRLFLNSLIRNKFLVISISGFVFLFSCIYATLKEKTYEGQFQIVLDSKSSVGSLGSFLRNSGLQGLNFSSNKSDDLLTQVGILRSQSVLMPIFNYVNTEAKKYDPNQKDLIFSIWKTKLKIELERDTKILNIAYQDTNKDIIIPVLKMISEEYKAYAGRKKDKEFQNLKRYLKEQILFYKKESADSLKTVQAFANDQDLTLLEPMMLSNLASSEFNQDSFSSMSTLSSNPLQNGSSKLLQSNLDIENKRISIANQIRTISKQIEKIEELENNAQQLQYFGSTIPGLRDQKLLKTLELIEEELYRLRNIYTEKAPSIKKLKSQRDQAIKLLKERSINYLKAKKIALEAEKESAMRPKGVILKYKELLREANRNENTLVTLENQLKSSELESNMASNPWELITKPTLNQLAVGPKKKIIALSGLIFGLLLSSTIAILKEKRSGIVFEEFEIENILNTKVLKKIFINEELINEFEFEIPLIEILSDSKEKIDIFYTSNINESMIDKINLFIKKLSISNQNIKFKKYNQSLKESERIYIFTSLGTLTYKELFNLKNRLNLLNLKIIGIILIDQ